MGIISIVLKDTTEEKFRKAVATKLGMRKGNISKALEEAIDLWIKSYIEKIKRKILDLFLGHYLCEYYKHRNNDG